MVIAWSAARACGVSVSMDEQTATVSMPSSRQARMTRNAISPWASSDHYELFRAYLESRHADGGMADMDIFEFAAMIEETPIRSRVIEYFAPAKSGENSEDLVIVCLTDVLDDGLSMVYSFFDPARNRDSLGTYAILDHVRIAREADLPYVYLGYWVPGSPKMSYKAHFSALEIYAGGDWTDLGDPKGYAADRHPLSTDPITEQVARISLPDGQPRNWTLLRVEAAQRLSRGSHVRRSSLARHPDCGRYFRAPGCPGFRASDPDPGDCTRVPRGAGTGLALRLDGRGVGQNPG